MSYADEAAAVSGMTEDERRERKLCCVPGCPLPGTCADGTQGTQDWLCSLHKGADYAQQGAITVRIRSRLHLFVLAARLANANVGTPVPSEVLDWLTRKERSDIVHVYASFNHGMTARTLGGAISSILESECCAPQQRLEATDQKPTAARKESWSTAADLLQGLV